MAFRKSRPFGNTQPQAGAVIDWGDPISQGLVAYWLLNEGAGNIATNIAKPIHGTLTNGPTWTVSQPNCQGRSVKFDQTDDYIDIQRPIENTPQLTVVCWVNSTNVGAGDWFGKWSGWNNNGSNEQMFVRNSAAQFFLKNVAGSTANASTASLLQNNVWGMVACVADGANIRSSVNAIFGSNVALTGPYVPIVGDRWAIGRAHSQLTAGRVSNVRVYRRALTQNELRRLYAEPFAGIVTPRLRLGRAAAAPGGITGPLIGGRLTRAAALTGGRLVQ